MDLRKRQRRHTVKVEDQEEEDVILNFEIGDDNGDNDGLGYDNEMTEDEILQKLRIITTGYACIIMMDYLLT